MSELDVLCFSHLRWDFVFQRPNHLMTRCARERRVFYVEEPVLDGERNHLEVITLGAGITRVVPHLGAGLDSNEGSAQLHELLLELSRDHGIESPIHWFYSPMFWQATRGLHSSVTVYDCMDELTGFLGAPPAMALREKELLARTDVMFTGGRALYDAKRSKHGNVHCMPSSVDVPFFAAARSIEHEPADQASIGAPRLGYYGVIDERIDLGLLAYLADSRPDWQIIMLGPVVKVDPEHLPRRPNIHYLGQRRYEQLPQYASGWDLALMPFALNDATRFISPTKTPEYLAAGLAVVSTAIRDVMEPYEGLGLVRIGHTPEEFVHQVGQALAGETMATDAQRDAFLRSMSWDETWRRMSALVERALSKQGAPRPSSLSVNAAE